MLRLNLGDLLTWQDEEYLVVAARPRAAMLRRLADNDTVWVDVAFLADEISVADRPEPVDHTEDLSLTATVSKADLETARWWVEQLNEITFGVPDPDAPGAVPRPGYGPGTSKQSREARKVSELSAAGYKASVRSLQRKQQQYERHGVYGLIDRRTLTGGNGTPRVEDRIVEAVLAVLAATRNDSTVSVSTLIDKTFIESFNAQFKREQLSGEIMDTMAEAIYLAEEWKAIYNHERPHGSLDGMTPKRYWDNWTAKNQFAFVSLPDARSGLKMVPWPPADAVFLWFVEAVN